MPRPLVPILEQGEFRVSSPAGYTAVALQTCVPRASTLYQLRDEGGVVSLRATPPSLGLWLGVSVLAFLVGMMVAGMPWIIEGKPVVAPLFIGAVLIALSPFAGWGVHRHQRGESLCAPALMWTKNNDSVALPRLNQTVRRVDILAVEHVSMQVAQEKNHDDRAVEVVVLVVRESDGRVGCRELVRCVVNGRAISETLCRLFDVGLHVVTLTPT